MTTPIAAYSFLPWARQGLGNFIRESDQDQTVTVRGSIDVSLQIGADLIAGGAVTEALPPRPVQLYGPGDIIGIDSSAIVRTEPRHWITNFETNYIPFVEFYDEDFPWRYTPAKSSADGRRMRPWLALVVLEEAEFSAGTDLTRRPLPYIAIEDAATRLPPFDQLWAWAHVHIDGGLTADRTNADALAAELDDTVRADRDRACSRLLCPRILKENTGYHAFVIPAFETGRLAGLGKDPALAPFATHCAWTDYAAREEGTFFPYYHRWYFRTATVGDFEYLVRLLEPRTVDPRVGRRDIDVLEPGVNVPAIPELGGVLRLGGALRAPLATLSTEDREEYDRFERWGAPYPHAFQTGLASLINLSADYTQQSAGDANNASGLGPGVEDDEDPLIVPPLYGRWHASTPRLNAADADPARRRWVPELNLDPRHRVAAGFGTEVVQKNQETYMEAAWQQVGKVLESNQRIRYGQMALLTTGIWHGQLAEVQQRTPELFFTIAAPVHRRVLTNGLTVHRHVQQSTVPAALVSKPMRQALRPGGRIARLAGFTEEAGATNLLARVSEGEVSAAPPVEVPAQFPTTESLADEIEPDGLPDPWLDALERHPWLNLLLLLLAVLILLLLLIFAPPAAVAGLLLVAGTVWLLRRSRAELSQRRAAAALRPPARTPESVAAVPLSPDFRISAPGVGAQPTIGRTDSPEAVRFKQALANAYRVDAAEAAIEQPRREPLPVAALASGVVGQLEPGRTVAARVLGSIVIPARISEQLRESFGEVMVYPEFDVPMYEPLESISSELFLPNINLIGNNSITLLETNQKFIESYMVGLNHEFARELLWREYPTDQRGSYFRQFWDVRDYLASSSVDPLVLREQLRDIPELHRWPRGSGLGEHDHREAQGEKEDELVLVIRGELLKKYPTAVIYAHRAEWERTGGEIDRTRPRRLATLTPAQEANPPRDVVKTPLYEAKCDPDIYFFGFDLTVAKARGGPVENGEDDPGWFFVIKERPGEPRFGLDVAKPAPQDTIYTWNDLSWTDVVAAYEPGAFLRIGERAVAVSDPGPGAAQQQHIEDSSFSWRADTHSAEIAYILYQVPVLMAVHAAEMLRQPGGA